MLTMTTRIHHKKKTIAEQANTIVQLCLDTKITPGGQGG